MGEETGEESNLPLPIAGKQALALEIVIGDPVTHPAINETLTVLLREELVRNRLLVHGLIIQLGRIGCKGELGKRGIYNLLDYKGLG